MGGNDTAARLAGINLNKYLLAVYALSGMVAAVAGILLNMMKRQRSSSSTSCPGRLLVPTRARTREPAAPVRSRPPLLCVGNPSTGLRDLRKRQLPGLGSRPVRGLPLKIELCVRVREAQLLQNPRCAPFPPARTLAVATGVTPSSARGNPQGLHVSTFFPSCRTGWARPRRSTRCETTSIWPAGSAPPTASPPSPSRPSRTSSRHWRRRSPSGSPEYVTTSTSPPPPTTC
ncbi:hypothetical protein [Streptomyces sp. NPDC096324]|uniref:ABC transporter permease subunit n=1 Tax=Streptomyces sp. NPDC096324 TaxID=3366085 RepID=UPI00381CCDC1